MRISGSGHATRGDTPLLPSTIFDLPGVGPRDRGGGRVVTGLSSAEGRGGGGGVGEGGGAVTGGGGDSGNDFGFSGSTDRTQLPAHVRTQYVVKLLLVAKFAPNVVGLFYPDATACTRTYIV